MLSRRRTRAHLTGEDLVAVEGGYLTGRRRERVYRHLVTCQACQARLRENHELNELIRRHVRPAFDPASRAALLARLEEEAARRRRPRFWRPLLVSAVTVLILLVATLLPGVSEADSLLGDFVRFGEIKVKERFADPQPLTVPTRSAPESASLDLDFEPFEPGDLPLGYAFVARKVPKPDTLELYFENADGDSLMLTQGPTRAGMVGVPPNAGDWATSIDGAPVLVTADPRPDVTGAVGWERHGIVFVLMTINEPPGGLPVSDALAIVLAIITAQDEAEANEGAGTP